MYVLDYEYRKFYARTIDEALTIIGEQSGDYIIQLIEESNG